MGERIAAALHGHDLLCGLRDFFMACDEAGLCRAYRAVAATGAPETQGLPESGSIDWEQTLFGFNRLFVGPKALEAAPYASVWLEPEPRLMGQSTLDARHVYQMLGLSSPLPGKLPDDHLSLELDALAVMQAGLARVASDELFELQRFFLTRHVLAWMPRFSRAILELEDVPAAVSGMARVLGAWLASVQDALVRGDDSSPRAGLSRQSSNATEVRS